MEHLKKYLLFIAIIPAVIIAGLFLFLKNQQIKNEAIDGCFKSSGVYEYTRSSEGVRTTAPLKEFYQICLQDKGYSTTWK